VRPRWEKLTPGLVKALLKFYAVICSKGVNDAHILRECGLSISEANNFQKLRYFALVRKIDGNSGHWMLTWQGRDFIRSGYTPHERVLVLHNRIQERSVRRVSIGQVLRANEPDWLRRDDFIESRPAEAVEQIAMF